MFVCVARVTLDIPAAASIKAKRQVVRRVTDRVKAKFNVTVAEVDENEVAHRAVIALAVVANERRAVNEQMEKILHFIEDLYVAPMARRETETLAFGDQLFSGPSHKDGDDDPLGHLLTIPSGERSLAEAEGMGAWEDRDKQPHVSPPSAPPRTVSKEFSLDEARARARALRNKREWEKP